MIKIKEEYRLLIPKLTAEEFSQLEENCKKDGIRDKIIVWNDTIIDGHNRFEIANKWNLEYQTESKHFDSEDDVIEWMILNQFGRRNLSTYQRSVLALELESVFSKKAKENLSKAGSSYSPKEGFQISEKVADKVDTKKEVFSKKAKENQIRKPESVLQISAKQIQVF